jgi:hypothetical protein
MREVRDSEIEIASHCSLRSALRYKNLFARNSVNPKKKSEKNSKDIQIVS